MSVSAAVHLQVFRWVGRRVDLTEMRSALIRDSVNVAAEAVVSRNTPIFDRSRVRRLRSERFLDSDRLVTAQMFSENIVGYTKFDQHIYARPFSTYILVKMKWTN